MQNPNQGTAYVKAQEALQPAATALQIDDAMDGLREAAEFNAETVRALLRRLEPVLCQIRVGTLSGNCGGVGTPMVGGTIRLGKAPLAESIEARRDEIAELTKEVQDTIRALQI